MSNYFCFHRVFTVVEMITDNMIIHVNCFFVIDVHLQRHTAIILLLVLINFIVIT